MITVIGSINLDLVATVKRLPGPGETVPGDGFATACAAAGPWTRRRPWTW